MEPDDEPQPPVDEEPDTVTELGPDDTGTWAITTRHTRHVLDLDARTYRREPGPDSTPMPHDGRTVTLTRVQLWPTAGDVQLVWFDDPDLPELFEHWRKSSTIAEIRRLPPTAENPER